MEQSQHIYEITTKAQCNSKPVGMLVKSSQVKVKVFIATCTKRLQRSQILVTWQATSTQ